MSGTDLQKAISSSTVEVMGVTLHVHMLDNGERVIDADDVHALFDVMAEQSLTPADRDLLDLLSKVSAHG